MRSIIIRFGILVIIIIAGVVWYIVPDSFFVEYSDVVDNSAKEKEIAKQKEQKIKENKKKQVKTQEQKKLVNKIKQSVFFTVQAPHAQWSDEKYQDACEEACALMAHMWVQDKNRLSKNEVEAELEKMFVKEKEMFGEDVLDTSAEDTAKFMREYYDMDIEVKKSITMQDLYDLLAQDTIIIVPTNGKWLNNPHFSNGGPERHMLVLIGYNKNNKEFVTNDPGTRFGKNYKYKDSVLYNAIRDYQTGHKKDITGSAKNVIVVRK